MLLWLSSFAAQNRIGKHQPEATTKKKNDEK